jgi:hypothetical protein
MRRLVLASLALAGCSEPVSAPVEPVVTVRLSTENADANAPAVAAFFRRTCLDAAADQAAFEQALESSGWEVERTQAATPANPINGWQVDQGQLYQSFAEVGPGQRLVDCHVALPGAVAPSVARMEAALRPLVRHPSLRPLPHGPQEVSWQWRPTPFEERVVTIGPLEARLNRGGAGGRPGITIHFASTPVGAPPASAPPAASGDGR